MSDIDNFLNDIKNADIEGYTEPGNLEPGEPFKLNNRGQRSKAKYFLDPKNEPLPFQKGERKAVKDALHEKEGKFFHDNFNRPIRNITIPGLDKPHRHKKPKKFNTNLKSIGEVEFNSFANGFKEYLLECEAFPVYLKGQEYNKRTREPKPRVFQLKNRFQSNRNIRNVSNALDRFHGNAVFLTLTIDPKRHGWFYSWKHIATKLNSFMKVLRERLGIKKLNYLYVIETQTKTTFYPHVHILFLGIKRLEDWTLISKWWNWGFIWLNRTPEGEKIKDPIRYMMKYIRKGIVPIHDFNSKSFKNAVLLWLFDKRQFGKSNFLMQFLKMLYVPFINTDILKNYNVYTLDPPGGYLKYWRKLHNITYSGKPFIY